VRSPYSGIDATTPLVIDLDATLVTAHSASNPRRLPTDLWDLPTSRWPSGMRMIVRKNHPILARATDAEPGPRTGSAGPRQRPGQPAAARVHSNPDPLRDCGTGLRGHHLDATARAERAPSSTVEPNDSGCACSPSPDSWSPRPDAAPRTCPPTHPGRSWRSRPSALCEIRTGCTKLRDQCAPSLTSVMSPRWQPIQSGVRTVAPLWQCRDECSLFAGRW
jgi:hypothetical protein